MEFTSGGRGAARVCKHTHAHRCIQAHRMVKDATFFFFKGEGDGGKAAWDIRSPRPVICPRADIRH